MALTTSNVKRTAVEAFFEGMAIVSDNWRSFMDFRTDDVPALRLAAMTGLGNFTSWDGASDLGIETVDRPGHDGVTLSYSQYGYQCRISKADVADVPGIVGEASKKIGVSLANTYANLAYTRLNLGFGGGSTVGSGNQMFSPTHTRASGTRSNHTSSALDRSSFMAAITAYRGWTNYQSQPYDLTAGGFCLVVPPALEETAKQIVRSPFALTTVASAGAPAQGESNIAGDYGTEVVVSPHLTDANNWFLMSKLERTIKIWERFAPSIATTIDEDDKRVKISVDFALATGVNAQPDGAYGAEVS
tara:strand:- start:30 stop:938 length:909 start_codon:yes stop_codon:yes gene_type:complete